MNEIIEKENIIIEDMIYQIRRVQIMLSSDVAKLYQVETKRINEVIKSNIDRFPDSFCFQLTNEKIDNLSSRSQFAILNKSNNKFNELWEKNALTNISKTSATNPRLFNYNY